MDKKFNIRISVKIALICCLYTPLLLADDYFDIPTTPLISGTAVSPNMMIVLDSSYSMTAIVEQEYDSYDPDTFSYDCDDADYQYPTGSYIFIKVKSNTGEVSFSKGVQFVTVQNLTQKSINSGKASTKYTFGNSGDSDTTKCFENTGTYSKGFLNAVSDGWGDDSGYLTTGWFKGEYSGKFLNWYFSTSSKYPIGDTKLAEASTRTEVAEEVLEELVTDLEDMRIGFSQFDTNKGANVLVDVDDIDATDQESDLVSAIYNTTYYLSTPLIEAAKDIGNYFSYVSGAEEIILHYDESNETSAKTAQTIFERSDGSIIKSAGTATEYWCQDSFLVLVTDGLPAGDADFSDTITNYKTADDYDYFSDSGDALDRINTLSLMYETDLRPDLIDNDDERNVNNLTTYLIGFAGTTSGSETLTYLAEAGGGGDYLSADNSDELLDVLYETTDNIFAETAAMSSISLNSTSLSSNSILYQANFNTSGWTGTFSAYEYDSDGELEDDATWEADANLDDLDNSTTVSDDSVYGRNVFTYNNDSNHQKGVVFSSSNFDNLSTALQADLKSGIDLDGDTNTNDEDDAKSLLEFIIGDTSNEGESVTNYRSRDSRLGDIVNSTSVYVGAPELSWPDYSEDEKFGTSSEPYSEYKSGDAASRDHMVYVGANDGMLHGFYATTSGSSAGVEQLAYIPNILASSDDEAGLHYLADQNYGHQFYVDASPVVSDVYLKIGTVKDWHSILVGGLRSGGKGLYALDVTDPDDFDSSDDNASNLVLWEFSSDDDSDFGYSYGSSTIVMMQNGKWAVITGNGYNSETGAAKLFIIFIEEGTDGSWDTGDYIEIDTGVGDTDSPNGLSTPTVVDTDGDSVADYVYAGDLQGNMWAFDITEESSDDWVVSYGSTDSPEPLFTAEDSTDSDANAQPITSAPLVVSSDYGLLVFFGTGQYLETDDLSNTDLMTYYGVKDSDGSLLRDDLVERTLVTSSGLRTIEGDTLDWSASSGWFVDLVDRSSASGTATEEGERVISESTMSGDIVFFNTVIPDSSACSYGGSSWFMSLDLSTGLAPDYAIFDADDDGTIEQGSTDDEGYIGESYSSAMVSSPTIISNDTTGDSTRLSVTSAGDIVEDDIYTEDSSVAGRMFWEEMIND